jgi:hypothetical protein
MWLNAGASLLEVRPMKKIHIESASIATNATWFIILGMDGTTTVTKRDPTILTDRKHDGSRLSCSNRSGACKVEWVELGAQVDGEWLCETRNEGHTSRSRWRGVLGSSVGGLTNESTMLSAKLNIYE